jgi:hypothetical protein
MRSSYLASWVLAAVLLGPAAHAQTQARPQHEHQHAPATPSPDMSAKCKAMMADHEKMMADVKAADEHLDGLVAKMNDASGQAKVDATAATVTEIVAQRKTMRERMMGMQHEMMTHMMEHMQAGPESMAMCPMMKMEGMKH